jgi:hypothetical protein
MNKIINKFPKDFKPDYTPAEMFKLGIFSSSYFNNKAVSHLTQNKDWKFFIPNDFIIDLTCEFVFIKEKLISSPDIKKNCYQVECGSSFIEWFNNDWINLELDPYGWVNWYINYYYGRRIESEDIKQIKRWNQFKVRTLGVLRNYPNSLKTKQNLLHWAIKY